MPTSASHASFSLTSVTRRFGETTLGKTARLFARTLLADGEDEGAPLASALGLRTRSTTRST
jgi:hypothetical protein